MTAVMSQQRICDAVAQLFVKTALVARSVVKLYIVRLAYTTIYV